MNYAVGRFLTWSREGEISADRAGLMCCGSPDVACAALLKLLHGVPEHSPWRDPRHPDFNYDRVVSEFQHWETQPIIVVLRYLRNQSPETPYLVERLAALRQYVASGQYAGVLQRSSEKEVKAATTIQAIDLDGLAPAGSGVYAYVKCYAGDS